MASNVEGMTQLKRRLDAISDTRMMLGFLAQQIVGQAKINTRPFRKTGNLGRSIRAENITEKSATVIAGGRGGIGYARYVEIGTGLYGPRHRKITAKHKKFLSWEAGGSRLTGKGKGSKRIFARSVRGRRATPYLLPAAQKMIRESGLKGVIEAWNDAA